MRAISGKDIIFLLGGLLLGGGIGLVVLLGTDTHFLDSLAGLFDRQEESGVGAPAPDFILQSLHGDPTSLSNYLGRAVVLNFWATWCTPCRVEMPLFERYSNSYDQELTVLAVNMQETDTDIRVFTDEFDLTFPILQDPDGLVSHLYRVQGLPTTYFIDPAGKIGAIHIGSLSETQFVGYLEKIGVSDD